MSHAVAPGRPLVSVVVPTRNSARTLHACLESIRQQTYLPIELLVVDNASTDGTQAIAAKYADILVTAGPERSAQRNRGVELAAGEWVLWIDSDMVLTPDVVASAVASARETDAVGVSIPERTVGSGFWTSCRALERQCYLDDPSLFNPRLIRRDYLEEVGGFDEAMSGPEDADLKLRMRCGGSVLARCSAFIEHDEGRLTLRDVLRKRYYYGRSLPSFAANHPGAVSAQAWASVRAFARNRRLLARQPAHALGVVVLRSAEAAAYGVGAWRGRRDADAPARSGCSG